ncbi:MAG: hypothetical protein PHS93_08705 [Candidatus Omnitrophica bacterium]|nr:hypothetical protein [Candidatus Omnitrophota bacterium]
MNYEDRYANQMCHRMTNGFVKIWTQDSLIKDTKGEINRKIDTITEVTYYKVDEQWITRILTNDILCCYTLSFDERWKAERLTHELTLIITGGDIVNTVLERNQKIIDENIA